MIKIAITGNIAAGKSVVEKILKDLQYPVIDTDKIVHDLFINSQELNNKLRKEFSDYNIYSNGILDRKKLAKVVFSDKQLLRKLENITHPMALEEVMKFFEANSHENFVFVSVPLLYEVHWTQYFDKVILVAASDDIRLERLITRRKYSEENALTRMNAQMPQEEKMKLADFVVYNNSNYIDLNRQINETLCNLV